MKHREIKFRAWDKKLESMAKVMSLSFYDEDSLHRGNETESFLYYEKLNTTSLRSFDKIELMQYTGLKDKNGVEIYEGDLIRAKLLSELNFIVVFEEGRFTRKTVIDNERDSNLRWILNEECEVIGNIHENPELLKKAEEDK